MRWILIGLMLLPAAAGNAARHPVAAVLRADLPGHDPALAKAVGGILEAAGYRVTELSAEAICDATRLDTARFGLLVLPDAARLPMRSIEPVHKYLRQGGNLLALQTPAWQEPLLHVNGAWTTAEAYRRSRAGEAPQHVLFDFAPDALDAWHRTAYDPENIAAHYETVAEGPAPGQRALHVTLERLDNWDTFTLADIDHPFPAGHTLTVFSAKGGPNTTQFSVEWVERDGSRWIASIPLSTEWQHYVLAPQDFKYWESVPARARGAFQPENAVRLAVGLAFTHTGYLAGDQEYWVGPFGSAPMDPGLEQLFQSASVPKLDTISPGYKLFECTGVHWLTSARDCGLLPLVEFDIPSRVRSPHPRPEAGGFNKGRGWRWMPVIEAHTARGDWCGDPATLLFHADGPYKGGVWAGFGIADSAWYRTPKVLEAIRHTAERMRDPVFLLDGGADHYTYFETQALTLGLRVVNRSDTPQDGIEADVTLVSMTTFETVHQSQTWKLSLAPGETVTVSEPWEPSYWPEEGFIVTAALRRNGQFLDQDVHRAQVWRPKAEKHFITVENGDFMLDGQRWRPHGVNYMPSSGIGVEDGAYFEYWIGADAYDPKIIQRDLEHIKDLGLNSVSIFIYRRSMEAQNLLDLLRRLDALELKANLSLRPGTPMDFQWQDMKDLIEYYRLWEHDSVFALDLAWEPMFRDWERAPWHAAWEAWILERYGSIANAEQDWGYPVPRDAEGRVKDVDREHIAAEGPWTPMVAAYRRFLDTLLYEKYSAARTLVRTLDPNHLISFRMTVAGDPTFGDPATLPYDFAYLAGAVDLLEPEGYGRIGDWERVKPGYFTYAYGTWANPALPVLWAEAGVHVWDTEAMAPSPERLEYQAAFYERIYRMVIGSAADGVYFWWYPGGYRVNERSDYGILNPDGSERPVSQVIRAQAARLLDGPGARPIDTWLDMDRDHFTDGLTGIYDALQEPFWAAIDAGKTPGLRTPGTGTTSADCPLLAVGNTPCTGANPPKYLDGFFDKVAVRGPQGAWLDLDDGARIGGLGTARPLIRVTVTNLGEATWIAAANSTPGAVGVKILRADAPATTVPIPKPLARFEAIEFEFPLEDSPLDGEQPYTLTLDAHSRTPFGPKFDFTLVP